MRSPQTTAAAITTAPLILRIPALLIDMAILTLIGFMVISAFGDPDTVRDPEHLDQTTYALLVVMGAIYNIGFNAAMSATPGKLAMGLYIADMKGARIRPDTAILRYVVFLGGNLIVIGFFASVALLFIDPRRRVLHDRIAGTIVARRMKGVEIPPPDLT